MSSKDGQLKDDDSIGWTRNDEAAGIEPSSDGWDSKMLAYPCVVSVGEKVLMFYAGNGFGRAGFGYAELADVSAVV